MSWKLSAIALVFLTWLMANVVTQLEASFNVVATHATMTTHPRTYATTAGDKADDAKLAKDVEILRDSFLLSWIAGGCVLGACVGIWIRALTEVFAIAKTFGVSLFTSFCSTPWVIKTYFSAAPETCFFVGFLVAVGAWIGWEAALAIATRVKDAAVRNGWAGVKTELMGGAKPNEPAIMTPTSPEKPAG